MDGVLPKLPTDLDPGEAAVVPLLVRLGQQHLFWSWPLGDVKALEKKNFLWQVGALDAAYPGGLTAYTENARRLLKISAAGANPLEGHVPHPLAPTEIHPLEWRGPNIDALEKIGMEQLKHVAFVLVAGGLGERLGFNGIKLEMSIELTTGLSYLEWYCRWIRAFEARCQGRIPLAIMTSDDTHARTAALLAARHHSLPEGQIALLRQGRVPVLCDAAARFATTPSDPFVLDTKPHGHGDVHALLHSSGLAAKWKAEGRRWLVFLQDTNALAIRGVPALLGVSATHSLDLNFCSVPRLPKEEVGALVALVSPTGVRRVCNVEYNQLDGLLKGTPGDVPGPDGHSPFPGNTNLFVASLASYVAALEQTKGVVPEFVNPKYADDQRTTFKAPTRLECLMQDYARLLPPAAKVGISYAKSRWVYSPVKNGRAIAADKMAKGLHPYSAASSEFEQYKLNGELLRDCGVAVPEPAEEKDASGYPLLPHIQLLPGFACTRAEMRKRVNTKGLFSVTLRSTLVLDGDLTVEHLEVDGGCIIGAAKGAKVFVKFLRVENASLHFTECVPGQNPQFDARGYALLKQDARKILFDKPGTYEIFEVREHVRVALVGAGYPNLLCAKGGCDTASRLEALDYAIPTAIVDTDVVAAEAILTKRRTANPAKWQFCQVFPTVKKMLEDTPQKVWPHAAIIGLPPRQHGSTRKDEDAELILSMAGVSLFVEKPLGAFASAAGDPAGAAAVGAILASLAADKKLLTAVSYPLRYSRAVESLRKRLIDSGKRPTCVMARFNYAYSGASSFEGFDGASGIVPRHAADLLDLCRLVMGEVDLDSIQALAVPAQQQSGTPGLLDGTKEPPPAADVAVTATWRFRSGAVGTLAVATLLHGSRSSSELEVWADGLRLVLVDPHSSHPVLSLRLPTQEVDATEEFTQVFMQAGKDAPPTPSDSDPHFMILRAFIDALRVSRPELIRSPYTDAVLTHEFVGAIQRAVEKSRPPPPSPSPAFPRANTVF